MKPCSSSTPPPPPPLSLKSGRWRPSRNRWALLPAVAVLGLWAAPGQAANECGPLAPGLITCTSDNYNTTDRNIFYEIPDTDGNYRFEIRDGVVISGRRSNKTQARDANSPAGERANPDAEYPGVMNYAIILNTADTVNYGPGPGDDGRGLNAPQDDHGRRNYVASNPAIKDDPAVLRDPKNPVVGSPANTQYGGIFIDTHHEFNGDITLESRATITVDNEPFSTDVASERMARREGINATSNARGISVQHYGKSGNLDLTVGGSITSPSSGILAEIAPLSDSVMGSTFKDTDFTGDITVRLLDGLRIRTSGEDGHGVQAWHRGTGDVTITASSATRSDTPDILTRGHDASAITAEVAGYLGSSESDPVEGDVIIDLTNYYLRTEGGFGTSSGRQFGDPRDFSWEGSRGLKIYNFSKGLMDIDLTGSRIETEGVRGQGIYSVYLAYSSKAGGLMDIDLQGSEIMTRGNYADGILAYHGSKGHVDIDVARRSRITTEGVDAHAIAGLHHGTGKVDIQVDGSTITTKGAGSDGIRGGHRGTRGENDDNDIEIVVANSAITTTGNQQADGIHAFLLKPASIQRKNGDGTGDLTRYDQAMPPPVSVYADSGPWGLFAEPGDTSERKPKIQIDVDDSTIEASCPGTVNADGCRGIGIVAEFGDNVPDSGVATVRLTEAVVRGVDAVRFKGGQGILVSTNSHLAGNIWFADGDFNDEWKITGPGRLTGDIDFFGGTDTMEINLAEDQHFVFDRTIKGLETLTQTGGGLVRFAESAAFTDGVLTVQDGTLVLAGTLDLGNAGTLTVHQPGRLVFEVGYGSESGVRAFQHGRIFAQSVHFADAPEEVSEVQSGRLLRSGRLLLANHVSQTDEEDSPVVFLQLGADLTATEQTAVRGQLAGLALINAKVTRGDGDESTEVDGQLTVQSRQADGTDQTVGHLAVDDSRVGLLTVTESAMVAQLVLPTATTTPTAPTPTSPTPPGSPPAPATPSTPTTPVSPAPPTPPLDPGPPDGDGQMGGTDSTPDPGDENDGPDSAPEDRTGSDPGSGTATAASGGSGGSSSAGGVIGVGLLAALLAAFSGGDEATASAANYTVRPPSSASLATVNERGVLSLQEPGQAPYRLWLRTRTGGPSLAMTGAAKAGVDGTEVGLRLEGAGQFHTGFSVAPTVTAQVDSLHLTAEGAVYAWNSGWRSDRYFAGLRLSHGDFEVHSRIANPIVNGALRSQARLRNTQAQLQVGGHFHAGALRFTPSAAIRMGTFAQREHVAQSPVLRARVPAVTQDYTSYQFGLQMTPDQWLDGSGGRWQPQLRWDTIRTHARGSDTLQLHQSDTLGAVSFPSRASIRDLPAVVHSLSLGARVQPGGNDRTTWQFGFAGLEADGETHYAALATYRLRF